jgi:hypothetical protein
MKYIITEHRLQKIIQSYLNKEFGHLKFTRRRFVNDEGYVVFYDESGKIVFDGTIDNELMVNSTIFNSIQTIFSLTVDETEDYIRDFFLNKFGLNFSEIVNDDEGHEFGNID